jgi:hypothetical protein
VRSTTSVWEQFCRNDRPLSQLRPCPPPCTSSPAEKPASSSPQNSPPHSAPKCKRSTRAPLAFLPEIRWLWHRCKSKSGASPPACPPPRRSPPSGNPSGTQRCSSIRKPSNARRPKRRKGSASAENGETSGNGKIRLRHLRRLPQRLPSAATTRAFVEAEASSSSAAAGDRYPPRA